MSDEEIMALPKAGTRIKNDHLTGKDERSAECTAGPGVIGRSTWTCPFADRTNDLRHKRLRKDAAEALNAVKVVDELRTNRDISQETTLDAYEHLRVQMAAAKEAVDKMRIGPLNTRTEEVA